MLCHPAVCEFSEDCRHAEKRPRKKIVWNYSFGSKHPGSIVGHRSCYPFATHNHYPVPYNMGWLWNTKDILGMEPRRGWRPGAIDKRALKLMNLKLPRQDLPTGRMRAIGRSGFQPCIRKDTSPARPRKPAEQKSTLTVQRRGDVYTITLHPLKNLNQMSCIDDPYMDCDPLIFKITRNRTPEELEKIEMRKLRNLRKKREANIRKALAEAVDDICLCAYLDVFCNDLAALDQVIESRPMAGEPPCVCRVQSDTSMSSNASWDIEYTPPFDLVDPLAAPEKSYSHCETQFDNHLCPGPPIKTPSKKPTSIQKGKKTVRTINTE